MKLGPWTALGLLAVLAAGGFLFAASGLAPIAASSGHWPLTERFLQFSKRRAVDTHSLGTEVPPLDRPADVMRGAAHYDTGCRPCHGGPELLAPRVPRAMTPEPPYLPLQIERWAPRHLFWITKHGLKFTGMPAWPTQERDDEVWAMVAFLLVFPELDAAEYERLVYGEPAARPTVAPGLATASDEATPALVRDVCARCHGLGGNGRGVGAFPKLAGQRPAYLAASLEAYADGRRASGIMQPIAAGLGPEARREIAVFYAGLPRSGATPPLADGDPTRGREIAHHGLREKKVPACAACHGPGAGERNAYYPILAAQYPDYLAQQLELFASGHRGGTAYHHLMTEAVRGLDATARRDVAAYYASLTAAPPSPPAPPAP